MTIIPICHFEQNEESHILAQKGEILRLFAPQNDIFGPSLDRPEVGQQALKT
jgi:hypothetical protein